MGRFSAVFVYFWRGQVVYQTQGISISLPDERFEKRAQLDEPIAARQTLKTACSRILCIMVSVWPV